MLKLTSIKLTLVLLINIFSNSIPALSQQKTEKEKIPETHQIKLPDLIPYRNGDLWGYADSTGKLVVQPKYKRVDFFTNGYGRAFISGASGLINEKGIEIIKPVYRHVTPYKNGLIHVQNLEGKQGLLDYQGKEIIPVIYENVNLLYIPEQDEQLVVVSIENNHLSSQRTYSRSTTLKGIYSTSGKRILPVEFSEIRYKNEGIIEVCKEDKCQYINSSGKEILPLKRHQLSYFNEGLATLCQESGCSFVNTNGKTIISENFLTAQPFSEGLAVVLTKDKKWGYINRKGNLVIPAQYDHAMSFKDGLAIVSQNKKYGIIDRKGNLLAEHDNSQIKITPSQFPGKVWLQKNYNYQLGYIDSTKGKFIELENPPYNLGSFEDGLALASTKQQTAGFKLQYGYVDKNFKEVIPLMYIQASPFKHGVAAVNKDGSWGAIDKDNKTVLPFLFYEIEVLGPDLFKVKRGNKSATGYVQGLVNREGLEIAPLKYNKIDHFINGIAPFYLNNTYGMLNLKGKEIIPPIPIPDGYKACEQLKNGLIKVCNYETRKEGYVDRYGKKYFND